MVRSVNVELLTDNIKEMCIQANHYLAPDMDRAMKNACERETKPLAKQILGESGYCGKRYDPHLSGYRHGGGFSEDRTGCAF